MVKSRFAVTCYSITMEMKKLHILGHGRTKFLTEHDCRTHALNFVESRNAQRYSKGYRVKELYKECILKLDYEVDLIGLQVSDLS